MISRRASLLFSIGIAGLFFVLDRVLKHIAFHHPDYRSSIIDPWLGWEYFANPGVAFSIPIPSSLVVIVTPLILIGLLVLWQKSSTKTIFLYTGTLLLGCGALSNFVDRVLYAITIDYIRIIYSVINIADIMILAGALLLIYHEHVLHRTHRK